MNYELELNKLKDSLERAKTLKYQAEVRLEELERQEKEIIDELKLLDIEPENLEGEINNLKLEIEKLFVEANENLPKDILEKK